MSSRKKSRKGPSKVKNLEPRGLAGKKDENVKGGGGTVLSASSLQTVDSAATSQAATYDMLTKTMQDAHDSGMTVISNLRG
jgi:hypothetical protein